MRLPPPFLRPCTQHGSRKWSSVTQTDFPTKTCNGCVTPREGATILPVVTGFLLLWLAVGLVGCAIGYPKERGLAGFALGITLGIFGWIIIGVMGKKGVPCDWCAERVQRAARICPHCGHDPIKV